MPTPRATAARQRPRPVPLDVWNTPDAWGWLAGPWSLKGESLGRTVSVPGGVRFSVGPDGVSDVPVDGPRVGVAGPIGFVSFGRDGVPTLTLSSPGAPAALLPAVSATKTSVTFEADVDPTGQGATPLLLRATLRRSGPSAFSLDADARLGHVPMHVLRYSARKSDAQAPGY